MQETRCNRQKLLNEKDWTFGDVILKFPRFQDYSGELVNSFI